MRTDIKSAEMVKLASNAFLATKISFINEIANVCEETGADVVEVARGMGLDDRIGPKFLQAGIGFGGSCFPKDVAALKQLAGNSGYHFQLLNSVIEVNELQKRRVIAKLQKHLGLAGRQGDRAARPRVQAQHRRHARGVLAGALRPAAGRGRARAGLRPGGRGGGAQADPRRRCSPASALEVGRRRRRGRARHRVAGVRRARLRRASPRRCAATCWSTGATSSTRTAVRAAGLAYEGIGRPPARPQADEPAARPA